MEDVKMADISNKMTILDLSEDCLTEIVKYLDYNDLSELLKIHQHFYNPIDRVVPKKMLTFALSDDYANKCAAEMKSIAKFIVYFGKRLKQLKIHLPAHYNYRYQEIATLAYNYMETLIESFCANKNVKHLSLDHFTFSKEFIKDNGTFIRSLQSLELNITHMRCSRRCYPFLSMLNSVTKLKIEVNQSNRNLIRVILDKLNLNQVETLQLVGFESKVRFRDLPISATIKRLEIPNCRCKPQSLVNHFPNLEYLEFGKGDVSYSLSPLLELPNLRHLSLIYSTDTNRYLRSFINALAEGSLLETLKLKSDQILNNSYYDAEMILATNLHRLINLRKLSLSTTFSYRNHLKDIARNLTELRQFEFGYQLSIPNMRSSAEEQKVIREILKFVELSEKLVKLTVTLRLTYVDVPKFFRKLTKIRQEQRSREILYVLLIAKDGRNNSNLNSKYVNLSCKSIPRVHCT